MSGLIRNKKQQALRLIQSGKLSEAGKLIEQVCRADRSDAHAWYLCAAIHQELGNPGKAAEYYIRVIEIEPQNAEAHYFLGDAYFSLGDMTAASESYRRAISVRSDYIEAYCNLGIAQERLGQYEQAARYYEAAVQIDPARPLLHYNFANMLRRTGNLEAAIAHYQRAITLDPSLAQAHSNLGNLLSDLGRTSEALACYHAAVQADPGNADARNNLALMLEQTDSWDDAIAQYRHILKRQPDHVTALINLGAALAHQEKHTDAVALYRRALTIQPDNAEALNNLGNALRCQASLGEAIDMFARALEIKPGYTEALTNLGHTLQYSGRFDDAVDCYRRAIAVDHDYAEAHFNLANILLLRGEVEEGWEEYAWRWRRKRARPRPFQPVSEQDTWPEGRNAFVYGEQGLGDELFFMRFLPWLRTAGIKIITYLPNTKLAPLLYDNSLVDHVAGIEDKPATEDLIFSVGDLPQILGKKQVNQTPPPFHLATHKERLTTLRKRLTELGPAPYIGVTWRAGIKRRNALYKEIPSDHLANVLRNVTTATVVVLQRHPTTEDLSAFTKALGRPAHDLSALNEDLESMLALLSLIDEYVGVSNTNMHLRAAVGKTARVLVPAPPEWRWMAEGKESPWFPGFRVYRQGYDGSWEGALADLMTDLKSGHV